MPGPGDFLDPSMWPLFMQSGMMQAPPQGRTAPPNLDMNDPFARAAFRQQQTVQPDFGRAGEGPDLRTVLGVTPGVGQALNLGDLFGSLIKPANPGTGADVVANPQEAADLRKRIDANIAKIEKNTASITDLGNRKTNSPPGTQKMSIESMQGENKQLQEDNGRYQKRLDMVQGAIDKEGSAKAWREKSWGESYPGFFGPAAVASPLTSYVLGKLPGKKISNIVGASAVGALGGAGEGVLAAHAPTYLDMKLPGGPAKEAAESKNASLDYWVKEVGPIAAINALAGGMGAFRKNLSQRPSIAQPNSPLPLMPGAASSSPPTPQPQGSLGAGSPGMPQAPTSPPLMIQGSSGLWHYATGSGKTGVVPKRLWPSNPSSPPPLMGE